VLGVLLVAMIWRLPATDGPVDALSLAFPVYYVVLSLWHRRHGRQDIAAKITPFTRSPTSPDAPSADDPDRVPSRHHLPDGLHRPARLRHHHPAAAVLRRVVRRQRVHGRPAGHQLLADAVPVLAHLGTAVGPHRAAAHHPAGPGIGSCVSYLVLAQADSRSRSSSWRASSAALPAPTSRPRRPTSPTSPRPRTGRGAWAWWARPSAWASSSGPRSAAS
jgi:hypothetical protein